MAEAIGEPEPISYNETVTPLKSLPSAVTVPDIETVLFAGQVIGALGSEDRTKALLPS
jgi:hypothetical protein